MRQKVARQVQRRIGLAGISSLAAIVALSRTWPTLFWRVSSGEKAVEKNEKEDKSDKADKPEKADNSERNAGPLTDFTHATAEQLADQEAYIQAILVRNSMGDGS